MSIKIHHGPPGSYKTSGAVMDDFVTAALAGRVVVTNVRGLDNRQTVIDTLNATRKFPKFWQFNKVPESFNIIWLDTTTKEGRGKLAAFFHWVPLGAFLLIDEAQMVFPLAWKETHLKALDYPGGLIAAAKNKRPPDFLTAFEMHRHYGWDMVLTTPNISKIRGDIRGCAEGAYKHKNQALIGLKGHYLEAFHLAEDTGKNTSDFLSVRGRKIKSYVWKLYASTTTGTYSDTVAGTPLWQNPRVILLVACFAVAAIFLSSRSVPSWAGGKPVQAVSVDIQKNTVQAPVRSPDNVVASQVTPPAAPVDDSPFSGYDWRIVAAIKARDQIKIYFIVSNDKEKVTLNTDDLLSYGYQARYYSDCHLELTYKRLKPFHVFCKEEKLSNSHMASISKAPLPI